MAKPSLRMNRVPLFCPLLLFATPQAFDLQLFSKGLVKGRTALKHLLIVPLLIFSTLTSAQELHTFSNGEVADAEKINENFEELQRQIAEFSPLISGGTSRIIDEYGNQIIQVDCSSEPSALTTAFGEHTLQSKLLFKVTGQCDLGSAKIKYQQVAILGNEVGELGCSTSAELIGTINVEGGSLSIICANVTSIYVRDSWMYLLGVASPEVIGVQSAVYAEFDELWPAQAVDITAYQTDIIMTTFSTSYIDADIDLRDQSAAFLEGMDFNTATIFLGYKSDFKCILCDGSMGNLSTGIGASAELNTGGFGGGNLSIDRVTLGRNSSISYDGQYVEISEVVRLDDPSLVTLTNDSRSCSAVQDEGSVIITCADGTSGVLASAGNVVVYPEGGIVGESPVQSWPTGSIVHMDAEGLIIGPVTENRWELKVDDEWYAGVHNDVINETINIVSSRANYLYFLSEDCTGQPFIYSVGNSAAALYLTEQYYVADRSMASNQLLTKSFMKTKGFDIAGNFIDDTRCRRGTYTRSLYPAVEYQLSPELRDLSYPAELVQLP